MIAYSEYNLIHLNSKIGWTLDQSFPKNFVLTKMGQSVSDSNVDDDISDFKLKYEKLIYGPFGLQFMKALSI